MTNESRELSPDEKEQLLGLLNKRFVKYGGRHEGMEWSDVRVRLEAHPDKLRTLKQMEDTGGEPDVIGFDDTTGEYLFVDCAAESPKGRRSVCYDTEALNARKQHKPANSAVQLAAELGIELLDEQQYRQLQTVGPFDQKTSSWLATPAEIRALGGAIFGDYRYGKVFVYHNGADSYYGARGFRGMLRV